MQLLGWMLSLAGKKRTVSNKHALGDAIYEHAPSSVVATSITAMPPPAQTHFLPP
jgi:hypothetical protein